MRAEMSPNEALIAKLRYGLVPAVPTPFRGTVGDHSIDTLSLTRYVDWMSANRVAGVAVWAHTGRGLMLSREERLEVIDAWRSGLDDKLIIAGAGGGTTASSDKDYLDHALEMAQDATSHGADAILCYAPARFRDRSAREQRDLIREYHETLGSVGLPLVLFYLYEKAGGISYDDETLRDLLAMQSVIGIKVATLDSVMTFQDIARLIRTEAPDKLLITGEDRFFGYSLMCGARSALVGMGAAYVELQSELLRSHEAQEMTRFAELAAHVDRLSQATFIQPMEGYIWRMLYILSKQSVIARDSYLDPWGPVPTQSEMQAIDTMMEALRDA